jgi:outer membrane protein OmpA-like peptidoglycan-associated protein
VKKILFIFSLFLISSNAYSQSNKGKFREKFISANYHIEYANYSLALEDFLEIYSLDPENANLNYKIGLCYIKSARNRIEAIPYLEKAIRNVSSSYDDLDPSEKKSPVIAYYYLGFVYHLNHQFPESVEHLEKYKTFLGKKNYMIQEADRVISWCKNAINYIANPVEVSIECLSDAINTTYPEHSPVLSIDESTLIFTSKRPDPKRSSFVIESDFVENIYISEKDDNGNWTPAKPISNNINTSDHEASIGLSADGLKLFIYRGINGGSIFMTELGENDDWSFPQELTFINSKYWETHATISADQQFIYFVSDRPGPNAQGGKDIWMCKRLPNGQWAKPQNLGPEINTPYDEEAPFIHPDGKTIFFSSNGHQTMGGMDIFYSEILESGRWSEPINVGYPINTTDDDVSYIVSADGRRAYFSSVRDNCKGEKDIFMANLDKVLIEAQAVVSGRVTFNGSEELPEGLIIFVTDPISGKVAQQTKPRFKNGRWTFVFSLPEGYTYDVTFALDGYDPADSQLKVPMGSAEKPMTNYLLELMTFEYAEKNKRINIAGTVKNYLGVPLRDAKIILTDNSTGLIVGSYKTLEEDNDQYFFQIELGESYNVTYEADGYLFKSINLNYSEFPETRSVVKDITLEKLEKNAVTVLNNIFFEFNKFSLSQDSKPELEKLLSVLRDNPTMKVEISGHTDSRGSASVNKQISYLRASSVRTYLITQGIEKDRITSKGYGKSKPIAPDFVNGVADQEAMRLNRRVEFKIIK